MYKEYIMVIPVSAQQNSIFDLLIPDTLYPIDLETILRMLAQPVERNDIFCRNTHPVKIPKVDHRSTARRAIISYFSAGG